MPSKAEITIESEKYKQSIEPSSPDDHESGSVEAKKGALGFKSWLMKLSVETRGIERVTDEDRAKNTSKVWNACTFWMSANMAVATLNTGMVGGEMGLAFWDCFAIIMVVNVMACLLPAWTATFGLTGLRMTTLSRYSFGYWGNLLVVIFSMISTTGWNAINSISDGMFPKWAGVIIICTTVWIICALGITWIHRLDAFLWISPFIVWCVAAGTGSKHFDGHAIKSPTGSNGAAAAFSFIAVISSFAVSWINCAADYNVKMPKDTPRWRIFVATYLGITIPTILVQILGAALFTGTETNNEWEAAFLDAGVGGPLKMALLPAGRFGKFLLVLASLSSIPNNIPNNYSFAMHAQNFGPWALRVPRIAFVTFGYIAALVVGCCAAAFFSDTLQTFLSIIGYWTIIHLVIIIEEHIIFRHSRWSNYNWEAWANWELLPFGWSAIGAFAMGFVGAALGMKVTWYTGPIAGLIGKKGGNVGHELTALFCGISFPVFRWLEKRWMMK